jgi:uncharacterized membrane protein YoaK (UPF0700 family)
MPGTHAVTLAEPGPGDPPGAARDLRVDRANVRRRASVTFSCVIGFLGGCAAGALLEVHFGLWALALPVSLAALAVPLGELRNDGTARHRDSEQSDE